MPSPLNPTLLEAVLQRASLDFAFRQQLLRDSREAIYHAFWVRLPDDSSLAFAEPGAETEGRVVLPEMRADDELSEDDLDNVAGGRVADYQWSPESLEP